MVRCAGCGAAVSEWAARCPSCRAPLDDATPISEPVPAAGQEAPTPTHPSPPRVLPAGAGPAGSPAAPELAGGTEPHGGAGGVEPVTRARRSRLALAGAVIAGITVLAALVVPRGGPGRPHRLAPPYLAAYTVITTGRTGVQVIPLDGRRASEPVSRPVGAGVVTTNGVAFVEGGEAEVLPPPFDGPPRPLAVADRVFPMSGPEAVGLARRLPSGAVSVSYLDVDTGIFLSVPSWILPPGYQALGQYLAEGPGGALSVWSPAPGPAARLGPVFGRAADVVGVAGSRVEWFPASDCRPGRECPLEATDLSRAAPLGLTTAAQAPVGHRGFLPSGALSPDGRQGAVFVAGPGQGQAELALVDTDTLRSRVVAGSAVPTGANGRGATVRWSADGSAVFFGGEEGPMHAYRPGDARAVTLDLGASPSFDVF